jgi:aminocarboxymuconate-semialdehyde decarboxylase
MAEAAFVSCGGTAVPQARRREVVVNGKRVKTVDVHAHCAVPAAMALMGRKLETEALLMSNTRDLIHPQGTAELERTGRLGGSGLLTNTIGNPLETTIALSHLIFEGTLDRFPGLRICAAHGGGYLPSYAARSDAVQTTFPHRMTGTLRKKPTEYLRQLYYDSIVFTTEALRHLAAETGPNQIIMGTDYPFPWTTTSVDHILAAPGLSDADKVAMLGATARELLRIPE